ncbi:hypothetical protein [Nesterenkonia jeotgali]|uniref:Uncharacterized protein n=1 Tax=Nesterenkonia jeotgali TaxID=317018 RepID=A0A0W8II16_9MICC|nr:hypothetical protein [Nesterenkonia jeotgali]KUG59578.1 hypothetical protein AVL63_10615 [Nesterenkonia jeotgali]
MASQETSEDKHQEQSQGTAPGEQDTQNQGQVSQYSETDLPVGDGSIVVYSDPGRTSLLVRQMLKQPPLGRNAHWARGAEVTQEQVLIPLREDATLDLDAAKQWAREAEADMTVIITEVPRMAGERPKTAELHFSDRLAIVSLPALGPVFIMHSLRRELYRVVTALLNQSVDAAREYGGYYAHVEEQKGDDTFFISAGMLFPGRLWMTLGMVAANEPLWSLPKLSGVFAAAAATGAFGIFFTTIWEMANFLPHWRLAIVSLAAVGIVSAWLIISNRLWDRSAAVGGAREAAMYNISTIVSLLTSVAALYFGLFISILVVGLLLIEPGFMEQILGEGTGFMNYVEIAWLSASLGTFAGAIGANFDDTVELKNLTQGSRELQRYPKDAEQR